MEQINWRKKRILFVTRIHTHLLEIFFTWFIMSSEFWLFIETIKSLYGANVTRILPAQGHVWFHSISIVNWLVFAHFCVNYGELSSVNIIRDFHVSANLLKWMCHSVTLSNVWTCFKPWAFKSTIQLQFHKMIVRCFDLFCFTFFFCSLFKCKLY